MSVPSARIARTSLFVLTLLFLVTVALAQGTKPMINPYDDPDRDREAELVKKRAEWFLKGRTINGKPAADRLARAHQQRRAMEEQRLLPPATSAKSGSTKSLAAPLASSISTTPWTSVGPTPINADPVQNYGANSGRITAVAIDQSDATGKTVLAGGAYGGVWRTTDGGTTWTSLTDSQPTLSTGAITIQPGTSGSSEVILVGTGEPNNALDSYYGLGILRSTDGGASWTLIRTAGNGGFTGQGFSRFAWSTANTSLVVAGVANTPLGCEIGPGCGTQGIYFSSDSGATWTQSGNTDGSWGSITDVVWNAAANSGTGGFFAAVKNRGYYQSGNGIIWTRLPNQPVPITSGGCPSSTTGILVGRLTVRPGKNEMYAWTVGCDGVTDRGISRSTDGGATWAPLSLSVVSNGGQGFYDLYLAAVPNGANTDLYAAGVDIFKCSSANSTSCTWSNLTDVYGANPVHVHPDEHGFDFFTADPNIAYIGNDGGVYKITNSLTTPAFTNLNAGIGSLTQFISISQHPANPAVVLGGTQDNGSPATNSALVATAWNAVNAGDGGYNAIDKNSPDSVWYSTNTDLSIQRSTVGFASNAFDFGCDLYGPSASAQTGGFCPQNIPDDGSFYTPYILDPANNSKIIIATCRVWRGNADGSGWATAPPSFTNALSQNFGAGTTNVADCKATSATQSQLIRSLGAGGSNAGGSAALYAGMDQNFGTIDGHVFVKTGATTGATPWTDTTSHGPGGTSINPNGFPASDIFVDRVADAAGNTAYVTIMGFTGGGKHVWTTTNAGVSWVDISAGIPDAPANSVVGDPSDPTHQTLYVGTDVGVFITIDGGASWNIFGTGLPNVPVLTLRAINSGAGSQFLRAGTHGRGVWSIPLAVVAHSFALTPAPTPASNTVAAGIQATYTVSITGNNWGIPVTLSCSGLPNLSSCGFSPNNQTPNSATIPSTLTISTTRATAAEPAITPTAQNKDGNQGISLGALALTPLFGAVLIGFRKPTRGSKRSRALLWLGLVLLLVLVMPACGGGGGGGGGNNVTHMPGTTLGTYTVTINGRSGGVTQSTTVQLTVQ